MSPIFHIFSNGFCTSDNSVNVVIFCSIFDVVSYTSLISSFFQSPIGNPHCSCSMIFLFFWMILSVTLLVSLSRLTSLKFFRSFWHISYLGIIIISVVFLIVLGLEILVDVFLYQFRQHLVRYFVSWCFFVFSFLLYVLFVFHLVLFVDFFIEIRVSSDLRSVWIFVASGNIYILSLTLYLEKMS